VTFRSSVWFVVVGVINTAVYYALYLLLRLVLPYLVSHVVATAIAMCGSYLLHCRFTFRVPPRWRTFALFPLSNLANFVITTVGLRIAVGELGADERVAPLLVAVVAIPITYVATHYVMVGRLHAPDPFADESTETDESGAGSAAPQGPVDARA
jgi:putative flippase GtrA